MEKIKLQIEHKGAQMNLYKIKKYDTVKVGCGDMDVVLHENMWIGYDPRYMEYVICAASNPYEIRCIFPPIISNDIILTFINAVENLSLCCNGKGAAITFDKKELRWKICISAVQSKFVKEGLRELFYDSKLAWLNSQIAMNSFYGSVGLAQKHLGNSGLPDIEDVIFNAPATIVFWEDGTKTVVKAQEEEDFDCEKGLAMAIVKKALGNEGKYYETIKKWMNKGGKYL